MEVAFAYGGDIDREYWFSDEERNAWVEMSHSKRLSRMLGRIAVKEAARKYYEKWSGIQVSPQAFVVKNEISGVPYLCLGDTKQEAVRISLSHGAGFGVAAIDSSDKKSFGVDVERFRIFDSLFLETFLNDEERLALESIPEEEQSHFVTLHWSLKEACLKAFGTGLHDHPRLLSVGTERGGRYLISKAGVPIAEGQELAFPLGVSDEQSLAVLVHLLD